jgi:protein-tyrosine phosphatase
LIDLHCHILPGADDGACDIEESLDMARHAVDDGIHSIVATPHAMGGTFPNPPDKIITAARALSHRLETERIPLSLYTGAEIHLCPDMANRIMAGEAAFLCKNRRYVLVEFPFQTVSDGFRDALFHLILNGIIPVIAHPERNPGVYFQPGILYDLTAAGCLIQVNSTSVTGGFGDTIMKCSHALVENRLVHVIASDAHSARTRPPVLSAAVGIAAKILKNNDEALKMVSGTPEAIIKGLPVNVAEPKRPGRRRGGGKF